MIKGHKARVFRSEMEIGKVKVLACLLQGITKRYPSMYSMYVGYTFERLDDQK